MNLTFKSLINHRSFPFRVSNIMSKNRDKNFAELLSMSQQVVSKLFKQLFPFIIALKLHPSHTLLLAWRLTRVKKVLCPRIFCSCWRWLFSFIRGVYTVKQYWRKLHNTLQSKENLTGRNIVSQADYRKFPFPF